MKTVRFVAPMAAMMVGATFAGQVAADELNLYSARHYDSDERLYDAFTEETGIEVNILEGDSDQLIERIQREGVASPADIMLSGALKMKASSKASSRTFSMSACLKPCATLTACGSALVSVPGLFSIIAKTSIRARSLATKILLTRSLKARYAFALPTIFTISPCSPR